MVQVQEAHLQQHQAHSILEEVLEAAQALQEAPSQRWEALEKLEGPQSPPQKRVMC